MALNSETRLLKLNSSKHITVYCFLFKSIDLLHQFISMEFTEVIMAIHWLIKHEIKQTLLYSTWLQKNDTAFWDRVTTTHKGSSIPTKMSKMNGRPIQWNVEKSTKSIYWVLVWKIGPANNKTRCSGLSNHRLPHASHSSQLAINLSSDKSKWQIHVNNEKRLNSCYMLNKNYPGNESLTIKLTDLWYFSMRSWYLP